MNPLDTGDLQALLASGLGSLRHCTYWLLRIDEPAKAKRWLRRLLAHPGGVASVAALDRHRALRRTSALAFSHTGLLKMGLRPDPAQPFPDAFTAAPLDRAPLLGDEDTKAWRWGAGQGPDLLVAQYRRTPARQVTPWPLRGLKVLHCIEAAPLRLNPKGHVIEPFGFADGIGQPVIEGMPATGTQQRARQGMGSRFEDRVLRPGEFVLGHPNEYGESAHAPGALDWHDLEPFGHNGSYLALRQMRQDVDALWQWSNAHSRPGEPEAAELLVGRYRDGEPLLPDWRGRSDADDFRYRLEDPVGLVCPRSAHIRRANPRDQLGWDVRSGIAASKKHRLLRRGRPYEAVDGAGNPEQGLAFIALCADLTRQYELVLRSWLGTPTFGDTSGSHELTQSPCTVHRLARPALPLGAPLTGLQDFVQTLGNAYFFLPGMKALRFLAR